MKKESNWCFAVMANAEPAEPRPHLHCTRCGERMVTTLPMKVETFIEVIKAFNRAHAKCKGPEVPEEKPLSSDAIAQARAAFDEIAAGSQVERIGPA